MFIKFSQYKTLFVLNFFIIKQDLHIKQALFLFGICMQDFKLRTFQIYKIYLTQVQDIT